MSSFCGSTVKPHCFTGTKLIALITKVCVLSKDILCRIGVFVFVLFCLFSLFFFFYLKLRVCLHMFSFRYLALVRWLKWSLASGNLGIFSLLTSAGELE